MARFFAISSLLFVIAITVGANNVIAEDTDVRTCALTKVLECTPEEGCKERTLQDMALPRFVQIDLKAKTMKSLDKTVQRSSKIASVERLEGFTVLHGTEKRGWTMALGDSGDLTLSVAGDGEGFIVFGSCIP